MEGCVSLDVISGKQAQMRELGVGFLMTRKVEGMERGADFNRRGERKKAEMED